MTSRPMYGSRYTSHRRGAERRLARLRWHPLRGILLGLSRPLVIVTVLITVGTVESLLYISAQARLVANEYRLASLEEDCVRVLDAQRRLKSEVERKSSGARVLEYARRHLDMIPYRGDEVDLVKPAEPIVPRLLEDSPSVAEHVGVVVAGWCARAVDRMMPWGQELQVASSGGREADHQ